MLKGVGQQRNQVGDAFRGEAADEDEAERQLGPAEVHRFGLACGLALEPPEDLLARPRVGEVAAVVGVDGAEDLAEAAALILDARRRRRRERG